MDAQVKNNLGSSLTAASLAVLGISATLTPLGVSKGLLIAVAVTGGVLGVAGVFFGHLYKTELGKQTDANTLGVAKGAAVDKTYGDDQLPAVKAVEAAAVTSPPGSLVGTLQSNPGVPAVNPPTVFKP